MNGGDIDSRTRPFHLNPDPRYFYRSPTHRRALTALLSGIDKGSAPALLTGQSGTGKTSLIHELLIKLPPESYTLLLRYTTLNAEDLVHVLASELGIVPAQQEEDGLLAAVREALRAIAREGTAAVVIVDEAQNLCELGLNTLCEFASDGAIKLVLLGQPQLRARIAALQSEAWPKPSATVLELDNLSESESRDLVRHRLRVGGQDPDEVFPATALGLIHEQTLGNPRRINVLCERALRLSDPDSKPDQYMTALCDAAKALREEMPLLALAEPSSGSESEAPEMTSASLVGDEIVAVSAEQKSPITPQYLHLPGSSPSAPSRRNNAVALGAMLLLFTLTAWLIEAQFSGDGLVPSGELGNLRTQLATLNRVLADTSAKHGALQAQMTALHLENRQLRGQVDKLSRKRVARGEWQAPVIEDFAALDTALAVEQGERAVEYRVRGGDTLLGVAQRHQLSLSQIARWNGLSTSAHLLVGERLLLSPRDELIYTVRWGDTVAALKRQFDVTFGELRRWNQLPRDGRLYAGQRLRVLVSLPADS